MNELLKRYDILYTVVFFLMMIPLEHLEVFTLLEDETLSWRHVTRISLGDEKLTRFRSDDIYLVNTDEDFYEAYGGYPLRRGDYGIIARNLSRLGAKIVAIDALMDYPNSYGEDPQTAELFAEAGNVVLVSKADIAGGDDFLELTYPTGQLRRSTRSGYSNIWSESALKTNITRLRIHEEITKRQDGWPFAVQALAMYLGVEPKLADGVLEIGPDIKVHLDHDRDLYIDFPALPGNSQFLSDRYARSAMDLLKVEALDADELAALKFDVADKIVLVGDTSDVAHDFFDTPVGRVFGVEVIADAIHTLLNNAPLRPLPLWGEALITLSLLGLVLLTTRVPSVASRVLLTVLLLGAYWAFAMLLYVQFGLIASVIYNTIALFLGAAFIFFYSSRATDVNLIESERALAESNRMAGLSFQGQGQLDLAFDKFRQIPLDQSTADLVYNLGLDYERKRQFNKAISVYQFLGMWNDAYRDVPDRIQRLQNIEANPMKNQGGGSGTLVTTEEGIELPMLGRYEVTRELGQGAMGCVYLGKDPKIDRTVAIKTMSLGDEFEGDALAEAKSRFFREAQSAGRLTHPNIVAIYDAGEENDLAYIAMEFLKGHDLARYTGADALLPLDTVLDIGIQCAGALDYAHQAGVVHRDIKPGNIMYDPELKQVKITDFGIARITDSSKTRTGTVLGTPNYMSPEQALGDKVDGRSDLFSLGVVLYQLCSGHLPFQGESMASLMYKIVNEPHPDVNNVKSGLPGSVRKVIDNALRKQPDRRYQTGAKMAEHLKLCKSRVVAGQA